MRGVVYIMDSTQHTREGRGKSVLANQREPRGWIKICGKSGCTRRGKIFQHGPSIFGHAQVYVETTYISRRILVLCTSSMSHRLNADN